MDWVRLVFVVVFLGVGTFCGLFGLRISDFWCFSRVSNDLYGETKDFPGVFLGLFSRRFECKFWGRAPDSKSFGLSYSVASSGSLEWS